MEPAPDSPDGVRRVLVSGGAGFIGAALVGQLCERGIECVVVDDLSSGTASRLVRLLAGEPASVRPPAWLGLDLTRPGAWRRALAESGPVDAVVHLAARVGVRRVLADPEACRRENLAAARGLVDAVSRLPAGRRPRVLAASTSEVYADGVGPLREDGPLRAEHGRDRWAYAGSKLAAERVLDRASGLWPEGGGPVHLRFFNVVGPGQDAATGMVVPTFVERALAGAVLPVHGTGAQVRTLGHVDSVARALAGVVLRRDFPAGPLNLGGTTRTSVLELAHAVLHAVRGLGMDPGDARERIVFGDPRGWVSPVFEEVASREPDLSRARALGVPIGSMALAEMVEDCVARHAALALVRGAQVAAGSGACASPAS